MEYVITARANMYVDMAIAIGKKMNLLNILETTEVSFGVQGNWLNLWNILSGEIFQRLLIEL